VLLPAGTFVMGSPSDEPSRQSTEVQHQITLTKAFYMQVTEVTIVQWKALMGRRMFGEPKGGEGMPVAKVSWFDCVQFLEKLNALNEGVYRLPTEAEWEYACRAGSVTPYHWGKDVECTRGMHANSRKNGDCMPFVESRGWEPGGPVPVKSYPPNAWGLYDMHGNMWEWCQDWYEKYPTFALTDPLGPDSGTRKVRRGGSWFGPGHACRSANRAYAHPGSKFPTSGFRVVREVR
jgi:sulfatase modifying factor 1